MTVLDARALNRATLARQLLLGRADLPVLDAVTHLCGLQAQEPQEPFVGLWSRLRAFDPAALSELLVGRRVVRTHLMRRTIHLVTADDALAWRARYDDMFRQRVMGAFRREAEGVDLDKLAAEARAVLADGEPRTRGELVAALAEHRPTVSRQALMELLISAVPLAQAPPRGLWRTKAGVRHVLLSTRLGRDVDPPSADGVDRAGQAMVRRYLAAYGPAATADLRAWSGLAGLPEAVAATVAYVAIYAVMNIGAFAVVIGFRRRAGAPPAGPAPAWDSLDDYRGLARRHPGTAAAMAFFLICLAGLPPGVMGLFAKIVVFRATVAGGVTWLAVVMAVNTVIGLYYYLAWAARLFAAPAGRVGPMPRTPALRAAIAAAAAGALVLSAAPQLVLQAASATM